MNETSYPLRMGQEPAPVTLPMSKPYLFVAWLVCALLLANVTWALQEDPSKALDVYLIIGVCAMGFFVLLAPVLLFGHKVRIELSVDGVALRHPFKDVFVSWTEVTGIRIGWTGAEQLQTRRSRQVIVERRRADHDDDPVFIFPLFYGLTAEELMSRIVPFYDWARSARTLSGGEASTSKPGGMRATNARHML